MNPLFSTLARMAIGRCYVFMPMGKRFRFRKVVRCPDLDQPAEIVVDATPGASTKPKKKLFLIRKCSLWPQRKGCTRSCEK
jgi:hypothetical protein